MEAAPSAESLRIQQQACVPAVMARPNASAQKRLQL
jgi:hypothetical protein